MNSVASNNMNMNGGGSNNMNMSSGGSNSNADLEGIASLGVDIPNLSMLFSSNVFNTDILHSGDNFNASNAVQFGTQSASTTASTSNKPGAGLFLLGIHSYKSLENTDLPEFVREHNATLSFPEKLMLMMTYTEKKAREFGENKEPSMGWTSDGRSFMIHDKATLVKDVLPLFFRKEGKYASFTRKLYRWGFRQVSISLDRSPRKEMIFGHEYFQRDNKALVDKMRSVTAAGRRRATKKTDQEVINVKPLTDPFSDVDVGLQSQCDPIVGSGAFSGLKRLAPTGDLDSHFDGLLSQQDGPFNKKRALMPPMGSNSRALVPARLLTVNSLGGNGPIVLPGLPSTTSASDQLTSNYLSMLSQHQTNLNFNNMSFQPPTAAPSGGLDFTTSLINNGGLNLNNNALLLQQAQQSLKSNATRQVQQNIQSQQAFQTARLAQPFAGTQQAAIDLLLQYSK